MKQIIQTRHEQNKLVRNLFSFNSSSFYLELNGYPLSNIESEIKATFRASLINNCCIKDILMDRLSDTINYIDIAKWLSDSALNVINKYANNVTYTSFGDLTNYTTEDIIVYVDITTDELKSRIVMNIKASTADLIDGYKYVDDDADLSDHIMFYDLLIKFTDINPS